jgi:antitoxin VapB
MSLNIKSPEVYAAASRLARQRGLTLTEAVRQALELELRRTAGDAAEHREMERMLDYGRRLAALPDLDRRTDEEILGYGAEGHLDGDR